MNDRVTERIREHVQSGNREGFDAGMEWIAENFSRPQMPTRYERRTTAPDRRKGEPDWSIWRCPACGTENTSEECGYCRRSAVVSERYDGGDRGNLDAA